MSKEILMRWPLALTFAALILVPVSASSESSTPEEESVKAILQSIAGKESRPAGEVFKNVKLMKDIPAAQFLRIMDHSFTRALGVGCDHCHVEERWEADDKRTKRAAREMVVMMRGVNDKLESMQEIDTTEPGITCATCHRGH